MQGIKLGLPPEGGVHRVRRLAFQEVKPGKIIDDPVGTAVLDGDRVNAGDEAS